MSDSHAISTFERQFHEAMLGIYRKAKAEVGYVAPRFLNMVNERGGLRAAQSLLATNEPSDGFTELYLRGNRLDLSVEYLVLQHPWRTLFDPEELAVARQRLIERDFSPPPDDAD